MPYKVSSAKTSIYTDFYIARRNLSNGKEGSAADPHQQHAHPHAAPGPPLAKAVLQIL